jgi:hypothetical protein
MQETGKYIFCWFAPRHGGKSVTMRTEVLREVARNRNTEVAYASETEGLARRNAGWIRDRLSRGRVPELFGKFRTDAWRQKEFWVDRPKGLGGDPTICISGAESASTGYHWDIGAFDDAVGKMSNSSPIRRNKVISSFEEFLRQRAAGNRSMIWIIGTMWPGYQLYRHIIETMRKYAVIVIVPAIGCAENPEHKPLFGQADQYNYPWINEAFLEQQKASMPEDDYLAQYFNMMTVGTDRGFHLGMLHDSCPPMRDGKLDRERVALYAICDCADSTKVGQHRSTTAMGIVAVEWTGKVYLIDCRIMRERLKETVRHFLDMWTKWRPQHLSLENVGPARGFRQLLEEVGEQQGVYVPVNEVSRWGAIKQSRIDVLISAMERGRFFFSTHHLPTHVFRSEPGSGRKMGEVVTECLRYDPTRPKDIPDVVDMMADAVITDKKGGYLCPPPAPPDEDEDDKERHMDEAVRDMIHMHDPSVGPLPPLL